MTVKRVGYRGNVGSGARDGHRETGCCRGKRKKPTRRFSDLLEKEPDIKEGPVRLIQLPLSWRIEKDYGSYILGYSSKNGRFWKQDKGSDSYEKADRIAIARFREDIAEAAKNDEVLARKLRLYTEVLG